MYKNNNHRLFINSSKKSSTENDLKWAINMDIAICHATMAMNFIFKKTELDTLYNNFIELLPDDTSNESLEESIFNEYKNYQFKNNKVLTAHEICDYILSLSHRNYAFKYNYDHWINSNFNSIPIGLPRTKNVSINARNYTSHKLKLYKHYSKKLILGQSYEELSIRYFFNNTWIKKTNNKAIELTETNDINWLHTRVFNIPIIWKHINNIYNEIISLSIDTLSIEIILGMVAQIHWWLSHAMPYRRGSSAINDMFTKSILDNFNISTPHWKKDIFPDLEAFCTPLNNYITNYSSFFVQIPRFIYK